MSDGIRLMNLFKRHNVQVEELATNAKLTKRSIYRYQTLATIKNKTIYKLLAAAGIPQKEWDEYFETVEETTDNNLHEQKQVYHTTGKYHQGMNLHTVVRARGINTTAFANQLDIARRTLYRYFDEKELPVGVLLQASEILGVDVSELKGYGSGKSGFEKDIYKTLQEVASSLARIEKHLQIAN